MADFCKQCSIKIFGEDSKDLAGLSLPEDTKNGLFPIALCEGCGAIQIDHEGTCISTDCLAKHGK
jgi:hypothetical protein